MSESHEHAAGDIDGDSSPKSADASVINADRVMPNIVQQCVVPPVGGSTELKRFGEPEPVSS